MKSAAVASLVALVALAGCPGGDTGGPHPLTLSLSFEPNGFGGCLACGSLDDCALDCPGVVGVFLVDARSNTLLDQHCVAIPTKTGNTLRNLPEYLDRVLPLTKGVSLGREVRVEIAVFSPTPFPDTDMDAGTEPVCKRAVWLPPAKPATEDDHYEPSFWGQSEVITLAADNPVAISMSCVSDQQACATRPDAVISARAVDMHTQLEPEDPKELDVRFGSLSANEDSVTFVSRAELVLPEPPITPLTWTKRVVNAIYDPTCLATSVIRVGDNATGYPTVSCDGIDVPGNAATDAIVTTTGYTIERDFVDDILTGAGKTPGDLPAHGILIGRVVDVNGTSVAGAQVKPLVGDAVVIYLDEDGAVSPGLENTTASGWFAVVDPPLPGSSQANCCEIFQAKKDAEVGCTQGPVGLVDKKVMIARIVVDPSAPNSCASPP